MTSLSYLRVLVTSSTFLDTRSSSCFLALMADSKSRSSAVLVDTSLKSGWRADFVLAKIIVLICMMIDGIYTVNGTRGVDNGYVINFSLMVMMILKKIISTHCVIFSSASFIESTFSSRSILSDSSFTIAAFNRKVVLLQNYLVAIFYLFLKIVQSSAFIIQIKSGFFFKITLLRFFISFLKLSSYYSNKKLHFYCFTKKMTNCCEAAEKRALEIIPGFILLCLSILASVHCVQLYLLPTYLSFVFINKSVKNRRRK